MRHVLFRCALEKAVHDFEQCSFSSFDFWFAIDRRCVPFSYSSLAESNSSQLCQMGFRVAPRLDELVQIGLAHLECNIG